MMQWSIHINSTMLMKQKQHSLLVRKQKMFENVGNTGSEKNYGCSKCKSCKVCKDYSTDEIMSFREVVKQNVISP